MKKFLSEQKLVPVTNKKDRIINPKPKTFNEFILFTIALYNIALYTVSGADIKGIIKSQNGVLENAVVYIEKIEGKVFQPPTKPVEMDQVNLTFVPHVLPILVGTTVIFPNSDATRHNIFSPSKAKKFDLGTYAPGSSKSMVFDKPGVVPLLCHVHPEMSAFIIVLETPYFSVSNNKGEYRITNLQAGRYKLSVWHEWIESKSQFIEITTNKDLNINILMEE